MADKYSEKGRVDRVDSDASAESRAEKVRKLHEGLIERPAVKKQIPTEDEKARPDQYRAGSLIPKFLSAIQKRLDGGWIYQSFKLPGTNYLVRDLRDKDADEAAAFRKEDAFKPDEGKIVGDKARPNYLGERAVLQPAARKGMAGEITRLLSEFEKLLVERFEGGRIIEQMSEGGKPCFLEKTGAQWREFFAKFFGRSIWKESDIKLLKEFIYRGLIDLKKGDGKYVMLVGDMLMTGGQVEKFARLRVLKDLMKMLSNMKPGSSIEAELIKMGVGADEIRYLALAHRHSEKGIRTAAESSKGMFGDLKLEEQVAKQLGLDRKRKEVKGYKGPIKWGEEGADDGKHAFVPWGFWEREDRKGRPFALTAIVFTAIAFLVFIAVWAIVRYLL